MNTLTQSEQLTALPDASSRFISWFSGDFVFIALFIFLNIVAAILYIKTKTILNSSIQQKSLLEKQYKNPGKDYVSGSAPYTNSNPIQIDSGLME